MSIFVNHEAIERRKVRITAASDSDCRTVNHAAIQRRKERLEKAEEKKPLENKLEEVLGKDVIWQIVNGIGI